MGHEAHQAARLSGALTVDELKRRLYLVYLAVSTIGSALLWAFPPVAAPSTTSTVLAVVSPVGVLVFAVGVVLLWRRPELVGLIEKAMYALSYPVLLGVLSHLISSAPDAASREQALYSFALWVPLAVVWAFLAFGSVRGLVAAFSFLVATGVVLAALSTVDVEVGAAGFAFGIHLAVSASVFSIALFTFAYLLERQSAARASAEAVAAFAATDLVTGLPNRVAFESRFDQARALANRSGQRLAVYFVDLDDFKAINDTFGHAAGDDLLRDYAERLRASVRESDIVARLGGDEFVVLAFVPDVTESELVAAKLYDASSSPFVIDEVHVALTASIGISLYPDHGTDGDTLLHRADAAMYHTKSTGKRGWSTGSFPAVKELELDAG
jgi:diguanylate cyclase (GGDEF)-like protein